MNLAVDNSYTYDSKLEILLVSPQMLH